MVAIELMSEYFAQYKTEIKPIGKPDSMIIAPFPLPDSIATLKAKEYDKFRGNKVETNLSTGRLINKPSQLV